MHSREDNGGIGITTNGAVWICQATASGEPEISIPGVITNITSDRNGREGLAASHVFHGYWHARAAVSA